MDPQQDRAAFDRFVQISTAFDQRNFEMRLFALDEQGHVWEYRPGKGWTRLEGARLSATLGSSWLSSVTGVSPSQGLVFDSSRETLKEFEDRVVREYYECYGTSGAAKRLGISVRKIQYVIRDHRGPFAERG